MLQGENEQLQKEIFLQILKEVLPTARSLTEERIKKRVTNEKFNSAVEDLFGYIFSGIEGNLTRNEQLALVHRVLKCLIDYLKEMNVPITVNTVMENFGLINQAVDKQFPQYWESRLLKYLIISRA